ncbi:hypothetical protein PGTUg99_034897 [Puccinia graminis f. sp. tritici]|uniref:Uncharacterized protein n=1 Tax=Puccinia graminis f. sp. tritici TaxID=56615 RepID=A0A5B0QV51_PUCGR|nr:hypothetical protein PGTUg99_034897 [Puccinia graminis f. sp. tritici]
MVLDDRLEFGSKKDLVIFGKVCQRLLGRLTFLVFSRSTILAEPICSRNAEPRRDLFKPHDYESLVDRMIQDISDFVNVV